MVLPLILPAAAAPATPAVDMTAATSAHATAEQGSRQHTVRAGETVYDIARRYRISADALLERNNLSAGDFIHPGQHLRVPARTAGDEERESTSDRPSRSGSTRSYVVRSGDTLVGIAKRHDMSVERLRKLNDLDGGYIHSGDRLRVSGKATKPAKRETERPSASERYTVREGDTLVGIAKRHDMSTTRLAKLNHVDTGEYLRPGQRLKVSTDTTGQDSRTSSGSDRSDRSERSGKSGSSKKSRDKYDHNTFAGRTYSDEIVAAADRNREILAERDLPSRQETRDMIVRIAKKHGVDPSLALAISSQESGWNQARVSVANAVGVMQVIPSSGEWASAIVGRDLDLLDTEDNITAGVVIIKVLTQQASSTSDAIAGYYQGLASVKENGMYSDTKRYVADVKALRHRM